MTAEGAGSRDSHWTARPWQAVRRLSSRTPLRTKLITALLALVVVALAAISVSSVWLLRSYLTSQDDNQLQAVFNGIVRQPGGTFAPGQIYQVHPHERRGGNPAARNPAQLGPVCRSASLVLAAHHQAPSIPDVPTSLALGRREQRKAGDGPRRSPATTPGG